MEKKKEFSPKNRASTHSIIHILQCHVMQTATLTVRLLSVFSYTVCLAKAAAARQSYTLVV